MPLKETIILLKENTRESAKLSVSLGIIYIIYILLLKRIQMF
jgi:hypothetical protein